MMQACVWLVAPFFGLFCCIVVRDLGVITSPTSVCGSVSTLGKRAGPLAWVGGSHASWGDRLHGWVLCMSPGSSRVLTVFL